MELSRIPSLLYIQGGKELSYDFIVPTLLESHKLSHVLGSTRSHNLIKNYVTLALHVIPIYPL
jgi:hypothetical protein